MKWVNGATRGGWVGGGGVYNFPRLYFVQGHCKGVRCTLAYCQLTLTFTGGGEGEGMGEGKPPFSLPLHLLFLCKTVGNIPAQSEQNLPTHQFALEFPQQYGRPIGNNYRFLSILAGPQLNFQLPRRDP